MTRRKQTVKKFVKHLVRELGQLPYKAITIGKTNSPFIKHLIACKKDIVTAALDNAGIRWFKNRSGVIEIERFVFNKEYPYAEHSTTLEKIRKCPLVIEYTKQDNMWACRIVFQAYEKTTPKEQSDTLFELKEAGFIKACDHPAFYPTDKTLFLRGADKTANYQIFTVSDRDKEANLLQELVGAFGGRLVYVPAFEEIKPVEESPKSEKTLEDDALRVVKEALQEETDRISRLMEKALRKISAGKRAERDVFQYKRQLETLGVARTKLLEIV